MAESDKIKSDDIIQKDLYSNTIKSTEDLIKVTQTLEDQLIAVADAQSKIAKQSSKKIESADDIEKINNALKESIAQREKAQKLQKERIELQKKLNNLNRESAKQGKIDADQLGEITDRISKLSTARGELLAKSKLADKERRAGNETIAKAIDLTEAERKELGRLSKELFLSQKEKTELNKINKEIAEEELGLVDIYTKQSKRLNSLRKEYKNLVLQEGKATKESSELLKEIKKLDKELKDVDASVGQFQRSVGDYGKEALGVSKHTLTLLAGVVALNGGIGDLNTTISANEEASEDLQKTQGGTEAVVNSLQNRAVKLGKGFLNLIRIYTGLGDTNISLTNTFNTLGDAVDNLGDEELDLFDQTQNIIGSQLQWAKELRPLRERLAEVNGALELQNAIAGDTTRSFNEQEEASRKVTRLQIERADIQQTIAKREIDLINEAIASRTKLDLEVVKSLSTAELQDKSEKNIQNLLSQRTDRTIELIDAESELATARVENNKVLREIQRDRLEIELDFSIDVLDVQKTLNERRIADERATIEQREEILNRTTELTDKGFKNQIKLVEDFLGQKTNLEELALIDDEEIVRQRLKQFTSDENVLKRILEIIRERKAITQDLVDLEKDITDAKIEQFERDQEASNRIAEENRAFNIEQLETQLKEEQDLEEQNLERQEELQNQIFARKEQDLRRTAQAELENGELTAKEREEIENQLNNDLFRLNQERIDSVDDLEQKQLDKRKEQAEELAGFVADVFDNLGEVITQDLEKQNKALEQNVREREDNVEVQRERAKKGLENQLAFEERKLAEARVRQQEEAERQQKIEEALALTQAYFRAFESRVADDPDTAPFLALKDVTLAKGIAEGIKTLASFYDGTEDTGTGGKVDDRGGYLAVLHPHERVMTANQNAKVGDLSNDELSKIAMMYNTGQLINPMTDIGANTLSKNDTPIDKSYLVVKELQQLRDEIKNKPTQQVHVDSFGNLVEVVYKNGVKDTFKYKAKDWI